MLETSLFTYYISSEESCLPEELPERKIIYKYYIAHSFNTQCEIISGKKAEIAVIGLCIPSSDDVPNWNEILDSANTLEEFLDIEKYMAGRYVLLVHIFNVGCYLIGDATGSIQINYCTESKNISSIEPLVARASNSKISPEKEAVFYSKTISHAMPGNITVYEDIYALLPNHYLNLDTFQAVRFRASSYPINSGDVESCCKKTVNMARYICEKMSQMYEFVCPVTGGRDSRVVLALLREKTHNLKAFTMHHSSMKSGHIDLIGASNLCKKLGQSHIIIPDVPLPPERVAFFDSLFGEDKYDKKLLVLGETIKSKFKGKTITNGDIIGHIGKVMSQKDIPSKWMTLEYFRYKSHVFGSDKYLKDWLDEAKNEANVELCDLYAWEQRMGRLACTILQMKDLNGVNELNFFNCREIISLWASIPRQFRKDLVVHEYFLEQIEPTMNRIPYEQHPFAVRLGNKNWLTMYVSTLVKFYVQKLLFTLKK